MGNILDAILHLKNSDNLFVADGEKGNNVQLVGAGLEEFIKAMFSDAIDEPSSIRKTLYSITLDYAGNANNPPDIILKNSDAVEVKKVDSLTGDVQLNSSPPKSKLRADDTRLNKTCRELAAKQGWDEKDIIYAIGSLSERKILRQLWLVYGDCIAANHEVYESAARRVKSALMSGFEETELRATNELGSIPTIDPLGITRLRVRGMWIIKNPSVVFADSLPRHNRKTTTRVYCIMKESKYQSINPKSRKNIEDAADNSLEVSPIKIQSPNNPAKLIDARFISYAV